jgi:hypothetical protein
VTELGRPISERLQAFARNGRLKRRIGAPYRNVVPVAPVGINNHKTFFWPFNKTNATLENLTADFGANENENDIRKN